MKRQPSIETTVMVGDRNEPPEVDHDDDMPWNWPFTIRIGSDRGYVKIMLSRAQADMLQSHLSQMLLDYDVSRGIVSAG